MVYLIDTRNGNQQVVMKNEQAVFYSDNWKETVERGIVWFGDAEYQNKIVVMTYAKFGVLAEKFPRFGYDFELILCDEIHSLPKFRSFTDKNGGSNPHIPAQKRLEEIVRHSNQIVIALSATPRRALEQINCSFNHITVDDDVHRLETKQIIPYTNKFKLLDELSPEDKGIVYITRITGMIDFYEKATAKGFKTICVWSENNKDHPMTDAQKEARDYIISKEELPPQYDMVIINASSETGINIYGNVDYIVVHHTDPDTREQIRGRYRKDLDRLYLHDNNAIQVPKEYLDCELSTERREQLCYDIDIRDDKGRTYKWNTVKKRLIAAGYSVVEARHNSQRFFVITL
jgi:superfamily II DNA or RNA helicase